MVLFPSVRLVRNLPLLGFLAGCATGPRYYVSLVPLDSRVELDSAKMSTDAAKPRSEVQAGFLGQRQGAMEVSLRIANRSDKELEVEPRTFSGTVRWIDTAGQANRMALRILDRNAVIQQVGLRKAQVEAAKNPYEETGLDQVGGFLDATAGLASAFSGGAKSEEQKRQDKERRERQEEREENKRKAISFENERISASSALGVEMNHLQQSLWSTATLKPGEASEKNLLLESHLDGDTLELVVPLGQARHRILFKQVKTRMP